MAGERQKKAGTTAGHRKPAALKVVPSAAEEAGREAALAAALEAAKAPRPPLAMDGDLLLPEIQELWAALWQSPVANAVDLNIDRPLLDRLFQALNERLIVGRVIPESRLVRGSTGQLRLNPLIAYLRDLNEEIRNLSERFGLDPRSRFRLGIEAGEAHDALSEMKRRLDDAAARVQAMPPEYQ